MCREQFHVCSDSTKGYLTLPKPGAHFAKSAPNINPNSLLSIFFLRVRINC